MAALKHPALRVAAWQWIVPEYRRIITDAILTDAVPTLPFKPVRVELVGSMVRGCAHFDSDLDFNLAAHDWNEQVRWRRLWGDLCHRLAFRAALSSLTESLGLRIDVAPNNPDQHSYDLTYDLLTGTYSNPSHPFPDRTSRTWNGYHLTWQPGPLMAKNLDVSPDPWRELLQPWREQYGSRFLSDPREPSDTSSVASD